MNPNLDALVELALQTEYEFDQRERAWPTSESHPKWTDWHSDAEEQDVFRVGMRAAIEVVLPALTTGVTDDLLDTALQAQFEADLRNDAYVDFGDAEYPTLETHPKWTDWYDDPSVRGMFRDAMRATLVAVAELLH